MVIDFAHCKLLLAAYECHNQYCNLLSILIFSAMSSYHWTRKATLKIDQRLVAINSCKTGAKRVLHQSAWLTIQINLCVPCRVLLTNQLNVTQHTSLLSLAKWRSKRKKYTTLIYVLSEYVSSLLMMKYLLKYCLIKAKKWHKFGVMHHPLFIYCGNKSQLNYNHLKCLPGCNMFVYFIPSPLHPLHFSLVILPISYSDSMACLAKLSSTLLSYIW